MKIVEGGIVHGAMAYPRGDGWVAVRGCWTGGEWEQGHVASLSHFRDGLFVGSWRLVGVDIVSQIPEGRVLILAAEGNRLPILPNDIFVFGDGAYSSFDVRYLAPYVPGVRPLTIGKRGYKAILRPSETEGQEVIVFHEVGRDFDMASFKDAKFLNVSHDLILEWVYTASPTYSAELRLKGSKVGIGILVDTLSTARSFVLSAGQEKLGVPRSRSGRYPKDIIQLFDPIVTAKAGSIRFLLHAPPPSKALKFASEAPLQLLVQTLRAADAGDEEKVRELLQVNVISVDASLAQLKRIVDVSIRHDGIEMRSSDDPNSFALGSRARSTLIKYEKSLVSRPVTAKGYLYGVNFKGRWCLFSLTDESRAWTLRFGPDLEDKIRGQFPRAVDVTFETTTPIDSPKGTGDLLNLDELESDPLA
jgi:hypothetical protein